MCGVAKVHVFTMFLIDGYELIPDQSNRVRLDSMALPSKTTHPPSSLLRLGAVIFRVFRNIALQDPRSHLVNTRPKQHIRILLSP